MEELSNFINLIYQDSNQDGECTFFIYETDVDVEYNSENKELIFQVTIDDYMSKEYNKNCSEIADFLCERFNKSDIDFNYSTFDGLGESFIDMNWTINILDTNRDKLLEFIISLQHSIIIFEKKKQIIRKEKELKKNGYIPIKKKVKFRPKARLLSILGEQLISNEIIAIKELVLNAFDADASEIYIYFNANESDNIDEIIILDNGRGMDENIIINGWFTPATSIKTKAKKTYSSQKYKRPIMGEKGVGRFACRRLGESLEVTTKTEGAQNELLFNVEWSQYDVEDEDIYLDNIENTIYSGATSHTLDSSIKKLSDFDNGTQVRITNLRNTWGKTRIQNIRDELLKLTPPFHIIKDFKIYINNEELVNNVILEKAKFYIEGVVDAKGNLYYLIGTYPREHILNPGEFINLLDLDKDIEEQIVNLPDMFLKDNLLESKAAAMAWTTYIKENYIEKGINRSFEPMCGNFTFIAYAWDLDTKSRKRVGMDASDRTKLNNLCGISIYRDGFRVWPYGASGNDWLDLDRQAEGSKKPFHISNKQVIGYVGISHKHHPYFKDKTNREGFIENTIYFEDFKKLILLSFKHLEDLRRKNNRLETPLKDKEWWQNDKVLSTLKDLHEQVKNTAPELLGNIENLISVYNERKSQTEDKITNLLEVSSTGIVYESVTHELISFLVKMDDQSKNIEEYLASMPPDVKSALESNVLLNESLKIVLYEVKELQPFFKAARYQQKELNIKEVAEKAMKYFKYKFKKNSITYKIIEISPMKKKAVEGFILQILTNLIDNSIYWLEYDNNNDKEILITIDGNNNTFYFSDNGKGIDDEEAPYIFDPFFSCKINADGTRGRGLGLYIVQELLSNYRGTILLNNNYKPLSCTEKRRGTCFKIIIP